MSYFNINSACVLTNICSSPLYQPNIQYNTIFCFQLPLTPPKLNSRTVLSASSVKPSIWIPSFLANTCPRNTVLPSFHISAVLVVTVVPITSKLSIIFTKLTTTDLRFNVPSASNQPPSLRLLEIFIRIWITSYSIYRSTRGNNSPGDVASAIYGLCRKTFCGIISRGCTSHKEVSGTNNSSYNIHYWSVKSHSHNDSKGK